MDFPRLVYRSAADYRLVVDSDELNDLLGNGWFPSVPEAAQSALLAEQDSAAAVLSADGMSRHDMVLKANEVGLKFDGRISDAKLRYLLAKAESNGVD